ncbi:MAG: phosphoglucosamine mutase [Firmicutes bacterium]|nr:phosphoglucosamine mutase [Bacillota bacterium]
MRKYFGTDGIRRIANTELTPELAYKVAKAGAYVLSKHLANEKPTILIGRDTRISGTLIESAMTAGFLSYGADVQLLGVMPTPAVAYLTKELKAASSVVISASHNSYEFNGIKFFSNLGMKIPDEIEEEIEQVMDSDKMSELYAADGKIGVSESREDLIEKYIQMLTENFGETIKKYNKSTFKVAIDVSNGATYKVAEEVFKRLGVNYEIINNNPDGININYKCGSTHLDSLKKFVIDNNITLGIAYDGDGDRCLALDEKGNLIDGDILIAVFSKYLKEKGKLKNNTLVATIMSNMGLSKFAEENNLTLKQTKVGDRYVLEEMLKGGYVIGGEQSGHIIMLDYNPTGDGILTSLMLIQILLEKNVSISKLCDIIKTYPQVLINAKVSSNRKNEFESNEKIKKRLKELEEEFYGNGRVIARPSGTEPSVRIMIEGEDVEYMEKKAKELAELIETELG